MSVYEITYKYLGHTHLVIVTASKKGEYTPAKEMMESERILSLKLSIIHP